MKLRSLFFALAICFAATASAQTYKDTIKNVFTEYSGILQKGQFAKSLEYINPALFEVMPKEQMTKVMEEAFGNPAFKIEMSTPENFKFENNKVIKGMNYVKFTYDGSITMKFTSDDVPDTAMMKDLFAEQFGKENVSYDARTGAYKIFKLSKVIANSADRKTWTFVTLEKGSEAMMEKFIPKELFD